MRKRARALNVHREDGVLRMFALRRAAKDAAGPIRQPKAVPRNYAHASIYFIRCGEYVKIGRAYRPERRLSELQTSNPLPLEIIALLPSVGGDEEGKLHLRFAHLRHRGEWFRYGDDLRVYIEGILREQAPKPAVIEPVKVAIEKDPIAEAMFDFSHMLRHRI